MAEQTPPSDPDKIETQEQEVSVKKHRAPINLEIVIAVCAVLISIASFYATFLQANAAEKQVTAMTLPLLNFISSNIDSETQKPVIELSIANKGVGPAKIETFLIKYKNRFYSSDVDYLKACCNKDYEEYREKFRQQTAFLPMLISSNPNQQILPSGDKIEFLKLHKNSITDVLWEKLNNERFSTSITVCYCSLTEDCYWLTGRNQITDTPSCKE